jgi:hypothetical protein
MPGVHEGSRGNPPEEDEGKPEERPLRLRCRGNTRQGKLPQVPGKSPPTLPGKEEAEGGQSMSDYYEIRKRMGVCPYCGGEREDKDRLLCKACCVRYRRKNKKAYAKQKAIRLENQAKGLCGCGRPRADGHKTCDVCYKYFKMYRKKKEDGG